MKYYLSILYLLIFIAPLSAQENISVRHVYEPDSDRIKAKFTYENNQMRKRCIYHYNTEGSCYKQLIDDGYSENPDSLEGATNQLIISLSFTSDAKLKMTQTHVNLINGEQTLIKEVDVSYKKESKSVEQEVVDGEGNSIKTWYDEKGNPQSMLEIPKEGSSQLTTFTYDEEGRIDSAFCQNENGEYSMTEFSPSEREDIKEDQDYFTMIASKIYYLVRGKNEQITFLQKLNNDFEYFAEYFLGPIIFRISGFHTHPAHIGVHGHGEVNDKVRITLINGILNYPHDQKKHLELFSRLHGGVNIHHVFRPCEGWSRDMFSCAAAKLGIISDEARTLTATWRKMIEEMGGLGNGGLIIHYAHSIGGTETDNAKSLMTPEELKMIRVYTIASPTIIHNGEGFENVMNYVSKRDGVCYLDPIDYFSGLFKEKSNIVYLGTFAGIPIVDHLITNDSYRAVIEELGQKFVQEYGAVRPYF